MEDNQKIVVRQAQPFDITRIMRLLDQAIHDNEGLYPDPDYYMALNWVTTIMSDGYVLVAEKSGRLIGSVAVTNYKFPWSQKWYLYMDWVFVSKNFRAGGVFAALMKAVHVYADTKKAPIFLGISSGKDSILKDRLMKMHGYTYLGGQFLRETDNGRRQEDNEDLTAVHATSVD